MEEASVFQQVAIMGIIPTVHVFAYESLLLTETVNRWSPTIPDPQMSLLSPVQLSAE